MRFKLVTWNLHRYIGHDGVASPQRCAEVLREIDAELIVLQEVESHPGEAHDALALLCRETDCQAADGSTMALGDGRYGTAMLSRFPPQLSSWPARAPLFSLDRIRVRPRPALQRLWVHRSHLARVASDHLPLVADLSIE